MKTKEKKTTRRRPSQSRSPLGVRSIVVPLDFSPESRRALTYAISLARRLDARLTLLHVVEPVAAPNFAAPIPLAMENDRVMAAAQSELEKLARKEKIPRELLEKSVVRFGRSFHEITDAARTRKADLIVIATHGRTGFKRALLGSTAERVVRHAPCAVLVVRPH